MAKERGGRGRAKKKGGGYKKRDVRRGKRVKRKWKKKKKRKKRVEGAPGFEPGTSRSAVECSTTELYPQFKVEVCCMSFIIVTYK